MDLYNRQRNHVPLGIAYHHRLLNYLTWLNLNALTGLAGGLLVRFTGWRTWPIRVTVNVYFSQGNS